MLRVGAAIKDQSHLDRKGLSHTREENLRWMLGHMKGTPAEKEAFLRVRLESEESPPLRAGVLASQYRRRVL